MAHPGIRLAALLLILALNASGQGRIPRLPQRVTVDIQVYLPGGAPPRHPIPIFLSSEDGRVSETVFARRNGWASAHGLVENTMMTLVVPAEEGVYQSTMFSFPAAEGRVVIHLKPYPGAKVSAMSVGELREPNPKARKLYEEAIRDARRQRFGDAEAKVRSAMALDPRYTAPVILLGRLRLNQQEFAQAEALFQQALDVDPKSPAALTGLGIARSGRNDFHGALPPLEEAKRLTSDPEVHFHLGVALMETGRMDEAERLLRNVAEGSSALSDTSHFALGRLYYLRGDRAKGLNSLQTFLARRPHGPVADVARETMRQLQLLSPGPH